MRSIYLMDQNNFLPGERSIFHANFILSDFDEIRIEIIAVLAILASIFNYKEFQREIPNRPQVPVFRWPIF
jgi:hypothetical protein